MRSELRDGRHIWRPYVVLGCMFGERCRAAIYRGRRFWKMSEIRRTKQIAVQNENYRSKAPLGGRLGCAFCERDGEAFLTTMDHKTIKNRAGSNASGPVIMKPD